MPVLPVHEVVRRLRARGEPATLFGEEERQRAARLHSLEVADGEGMEGQRNDLQMEAERIAREAAMPEDLRQQSIKEAERLPRMSTSAETLRLSELDDKRYAGLSDEATVHDFLVDVLELWDAHLAAGGVAKWGTKALYQQQLAQASQTKNYLGPLFKLLRKKAVNGDVLQNLARVVRACLRTEYMQANDYYLQLAIGNSAWPLGVTQVGIHARKARERIGSDQIAHVLNDETQRKYIQSVKRAMTMMQTMRPTLPSKSVG